MIASNFSRALRIARSHWGRDWRPTHWASAPGRIELLGNHVDYNGGQVIAAAIDKRTLALWQQFDDDRNVLQSLFADFPELGDFGTEIATTLSWRLPDEDFHTPFDYVRGVCSVGQDQQAMTAGGGRAIVAGDVPIGFGVSSSAALCLALTGALHRDKPIGKELVLRAQEAEHRAGTPCGTMDQSAAAAGDVILYDAATMDFVPLQPDLGDYAFILIDSTVQRSLATSSYSQRVLECSAAVEILRSKIDPTLPNLASVTTSQLALGLPILPQTLGMRARHIVSEVGRVSQGVDAVSRNDWHWFGTLMTESGRSSALDYEISHPLVEDIVAASLEVAGVLGARMMGGGEGGAVLVLVHKDRVQHLARSIERCFINSDNPAFTVRLSQVAFGPGMKRGQFTQDGPLENVT